MPFIAVTGVTASGKSFVSKLLAELLQCPYYDCDQIVHEIYQTDCRSLFKDLIEIQPALNSNGSLDKAILKNIILTNPQFLKQIQFILYPFLKKKIQIIIEQAKKDELKHLIFEVPLLFESNFHHLFDLHINININEENQKIRALEKRKIDPELYQIFCANQFPNEVKAALAHINFNNNQAIESLIKQIKAFVELYDQ